MQKKHIRSQAALEFMTTYGWAFLVILLTVAVLYSSGILDFKKYLPKECVFPSQFTCLDFTMDSSGTGEIKFKLINGIGEELNVTYTNVTNDATPPLECGTPPSLPQNWIDGAEKDFIFTSCSGPDFLSGEHIEATVTIKWCAVNTPGCPEHTINGKIKAIVR